MYTSGGYRLGVGIFPEPRGAIDSALKIAGSTYSCAAAPIQYAALEAYSLSDDVESHVRQCRELNALVGRRTAARFAEVPGVRTSTPFGAFYLFVDFNEQRRELQRLGLDTCAAFCEEVLRTDHVAMLPGESLLLPEDEFAVHCSFVDYDGDAALSAWREQPPAGPSEEDAFLRTHCPLIAGGVEHVSRFLEEVRSGGRPEHA